MKKLIKFSPFILLFSWLFLQDYGSQIPYINISLRSFLHLNAVAFIVASVIRFRSWRKEISIVTLLLSVFFYWQHGPWAQYLLLGLVLLPQLPSPFHYKNIEEIYLFVYSFFKKHFWVALIMLTTLLILWLYRDIWSLYFQGDEWYWFKRYAPLVNKPTWFIEGLLDIFRTYDELGFHMSPVANSLYIIQFRLFKLNFIPYILVSLILHLSNSLAVGVFAYQIKRSKLFAALATFFFATVATHHEAVTWVAAVTNTQCAVLFGLIGMIFLLQYQKEQKQRFLHYAGLFVGLGLLSKETAVVFLLLFCVLYFRFVRSLSFRDWRKTWVFWSFVIFFIAIRIPRDHLPTLLPTQPANTDLVSINQASEKLNTQLLTFRAIAIPLKVFPQTIIPASFVMRVSIWITDMQFPFFSADKKIGSPMYANFIQAAAPEFITYFFSLLFFFSLRVIPKKYNHIKNLGLLIFLLGMPAIFGNIIKFPFLATSTFISSRHFYHLNIGISLLFPFFMIGLSESLAKKWRTNKNTVLLLLLILWTLLQSYWIHEQLLYHLEQAAERKYIISEMMKAIPNPPKKMIIYTTSNRNYYGFAALMLPFQFPFSHMLPTLFHQVYNAHGHDYPLFFYGKEYMPTGGLTTQGYVEHDGYGLGYFLEQKPLLKELEKNGFDANMVYGFKYDGDGVYLENITEGLRKELNELLISRKQLASWKRYGSREHMLSFQADPAWQVTYQDHTYQIKDNDELILQIMFAGAEEYTGTDLYGQFIAEQEVEGRRVDHDFVTESIYADLDIPRLVYFPLWTRNVFFISAGNNLKFFRFDVGNREKATQVMRTLELEDSPDDALSLP